MWWKKREPVNVQALWAQEQALSKRKRRARYRCKRNFVRLNDIDPWTTYVTQLTEYQNIHSQPVSPSTLVAEVTPASTSVTESVIPETSETDSAKPPQPPESATPESGSTNSPQTSENTPETPESGNAKPPQSSENATETIPSESGNAKPQPSEKATETIPSESENAKPPQSSENATPESGSANSPQTSENAKIIPIESDNTRPQSSEKATETIPSESENAKLPQSSENATPESGNAKPPQSSENATETIPSESGNVNPPQSSENATETIPPVLGNENPSPPAESKPEESTENESNKKYLPNIHINRKLSVWRGDITRLEIDAIVNAANSSLLGGGGIDGAIHRAAGDTLLAECETLGGAQTGQTKITRAYDLPSLFVLHTVGPIGENEEKLVSCYSSCLDLAVQHDLKTVAFCGISTGIFGYPLYNASHVACRTIRKWMENPENLAKVDRIIFCTFLPKEEVCYNELLPMYFPPAPDPEFVKEYNENKVAYTSTPESSETESEDEDEEDEEEETEEEEVEVKKDPNQVDLEKKDSAPSFVFGKASIPPGQSEVVISIPANGFQSKWNTVYYVFTPRGSFSRLFIKSELKERQFVVASADTDRTQEAHFDWMLHGESDK